MRCEHKVGGWWSDSGREVLLCGRRLWPKTSKLILGGRRWHVFRCRRNHETRVVVKP